MDDACLIMMAAYNSERFLREQLDSLLAQTHQNWKLLIQDDGSTDSTVDIIHEYMRKDPRIDFTINTGEQHGTYPNFYTLISKCKKIESYDYYLFCDHDDIWLPEKIERLLKECHEIEQPGSPLLVYANLKVIDAEGRVTTESFLQVMDSSYVSRYPVSEFFQGNIHGCNMIMNRVLFDMVPEVDADSEVAAILPHDVYYPQVCAIKGDIGFVYEPLMQYRRYGNNVSQQSYSKGLEWYLSKLSLKRLRSLPEIHGRRYSISLYTIEIIKQLPLSDSEEELLKGIESALRTGGITAVRFFHKHHVSSGKWIRTANAYLILFTKVYKKYMVDYEM